MKKFWKEADYKAARRRHERYEAKRRKHFKAALAKKHRAARGRPTTSRSRPRPEKVLAAPVIFSMARNADDMNRFFVRLTQEAEEGNRVFVDLSGVKVLTLDAIAVLNARIHDTRFAYGGIRGNVPEDRSLHAILVASGFFKHMANAGAFPRPHPSAGGQTFHERTGLRGGQETAQSLRQAISAEPVRGLYHVLMEAMNNTGDHATPANLRRRGLAYKWWVSAYRAPGKKTAHFAFVDNGMGILASLNEQRERMSSPWSWPDSDAIVLKRVFDGQIPSSTFKPERGKGLPAIQRKVDLGLLRNMTVISNGAIGNLDTSTFRNVKYPFTGTVLTWEIDL
jgi:hypothetical protein